ncbi:MFS general substrate transporter [Xylariaceae sp. FL0594]|nr:MFS general substrate transporter [Xylariaceae sp. FL0594]
MPEEETITAPRPEATTRTSRPRPSLAHRVVPETGLATLWRAPRDVKLLCAQRFVRMLGYGVTTLVLVAYLSCALGSGSGNGNGNEKTEIGLFMTLTLAGDVCVSFVLTLFADEALGRRATLALGALMMSGSGLAFALVSVGSSSSSSSDYYYWVLLLAAVVGVISPNGNEIGPFRAIEESIVAHLTPAEHRSDIYAWYSLLGLAGAALGSFLCGWTLQYLTESRGWAAMSSYRAAFAIYAVVGLLKLCLTLSLSPGVESEASQKRRNMKKQKRNGTMITEGGGGEAARTNDEATPLLSDNNNDGRDDRPGAPHQTTSPPSSNNRRRRIRALLPDISRESISVVAILCFLFGLDALGTGVNPMSWVTYYFQWRFNIEKGTLGSIFFVTQLVGAASLILASSISKRLGNVKTMVLTHLPAQVFRALIGVPGDARLALLFCILNASISSMDTAPRAAFLAAIIPAGERTAVMGALNVVKTTAASLGPIATGLLVDHKLYWLSFVLGGTLKGLYDVGILVFFWHKEKERDRGARQRAQHSDGQGDEEHTA